MQDTASRVPFTTFVLAAAALLVFTRAPLVAQAAVSAAAVSPAAPRFEVASIRRNTMTTEELIRSGAPFGIRELPGGRMSASMVSLRTLMLHAYELREYQLETPARGFPDGTYDVTATAGRDVTPEGMRAMLRTLLAERFGVRARSDMRQAPLEVLSMARSDGRLGAGLRPTSAECRAQPADSQAASVSLSPSHGGSTSIDSGTDKGAKPPCGYFLPGVDVRSGATALVATGIPVSALVIWIDQELRRPVVDRTGLDGYFDLTMQYESPRAVRGLDLGAGRDSTAPTLGAALRDQLGLKLERGMGPLQMIVVEAAHTPTAD